VQKSERAAAQETIDMTDAFIFDHVRTPRGRGRSNGGLHGVPPVELAAQMLRALRERSQLDPTRVEEVILGCVNPVGEQGADIARPAALLALGESVPGIQIDRYCSSSLDACNLAAAQVMAGQLELAIAGGVESMSRIPIGSQVFTSTRWVLQPIWSRHAQGSPVATSTTTHSRVSDEPRGHGTRGGFPARSSR
jgi:acetyl-CoA acetyltransferase